MILCLPTSAVFSSASSPSAGGAESSAAALAASFILFTRESTNSFDTSVPLRVIEKLLGVSISRLVRASSSLSSRKFMHRFRCLNCLFLTNFHTPSSTYSMSSAKGTGSSFPGLAFLFFSTTASLSFTSFNYSSTLSASKGCLPN